MREVAVLFNFQRFASAFWSKFSDSHYSTSIPVTSLFYEFQFLRRHKEEDGVRRSAVSGKKVRLFANLIKGPLKWSIEQMMCVFGFRDSLLIYFVVWIGIDSVEASLINRRRTRPQKVNELNCWNSWMLVMIDCLSLGFEVLHISWARSNICWCNGDLIVMLPGVRYAFFFLKYDHWLSAAPSLS